MNNRTTPTIVSKLEIGQIFVFGSNTKGAHGKGAAKKALTWGAIYGQGDGLQGRTYGIPTKGRNMKISLTISEIKPYVDDFIEFAKINPQLTFLLTEVGCGLAGYKPKDIAPLFEKSITVNNIWLPQRFWHKLVKDI
jgi:hypothetical protein